MPAVEMKVTLGNLANLAMVLAVLISGVVGYGRLEQGQIDQRREIEASSTQRRSEISDLRSTEDQKISALEAARKEDILNFERQLDSMLAQQNLTNQQILQALSTVQERIDRLLENKRSEIEKNTKIQ